MQKLDLLHAVLVLNGVEAELIGMRKVPRRRIHRFPAGYDHPTLFALSASGTPGSIRMPDGVGADWVHCGSQPPAVACWTLPLVASSQEWADTIDHLLRRVEGPSEQQQSQRRRYLQDAQFSNLAEQLMQICWP